MDGNQKPVDKKELSLESQEVVGCMREQIKTGPYPRNDVIDETVDILLPVLKES